MRALGRLMLAVAAIACQQTPQPAPGAVAPAASASAGASCEQIRQDVRREQARLANLPQTCKSDADCDLYGGHECPNALARTCPDAVAKSSAQAMRPLEAAWESHHCGEVLWSPFQRAAVCEAGVCMGR